MVDAMGSVCVFGGASDAAPAAHRRGAARLGRLLAEGGAGVVFGGGAGGLMGEAARAALAAGGRVHGIIPGFITRFEAPMEGLTRLEVVETLHERTRRMAEESAAFVALPGGVGTLQEATEFANARALGEEAKPLLLLDLDGFWRPLAEMLDAMAEAGYLRAPWRSHAAPCADPDEAAAVLLAAVACPAEGADGRAGAARGAA